MIKLIFKCSKWLIACALIGLISFGIWFSQQEESNKSEITQKGVEGLEWLRARPETKKEVDNALLFVIDWLDPQGGLSVDAQALLANKHALAGLPVSERRLRILENEGYIVGYDEERKNPAWVAYKLTKSSSHETAKRPSRFEVDERTRAQVSHDDYTRSGFDRGHMAPNHAIGSVYGNEAQIETFLMSNIVPQKPELNKGLWRLLEQEVIREWVPDFETLWVVTGPVYERNLGKLKSGVAIPSGFFKVISDITSAGEMRVMPFLVPLDASDFNEITSFLTSVDAIEAMSELDFYHELEDANEQEFENIEARRMW